MWTPNGIVQAFHSRQWASDPDEELWPPSVNFLKLPGSCLDWPDSCALSFTIANSDQLYPAASRTLVHTNNSLGHANVFLGDFVYARPIATQARAQAR